jgi:hypothetical protein
MLAHDPPDGIITDITQGFGNQSAIPAREPLWRRFGQLIKNSSLDALIVDDSAPTALFILQAWHPQFSETLSPFAYPGGSRPKLPGYLMRRLTLSATQNYLGSLDLALLCLSGFKPSIQLLRLFCAEQNLGRRSTHSGI